MVYFKKNLLNSEKGIAAAIPLFLGSVKERD